MKNRVFIIGAGFSKATSNNAPLGRELLKYLENTYDDFIFDDQYLYSNALIESIELGRKASSHYREIVNNFTQNSYSTVFKKSEKSKEIKLDFSAQYDLELLLSLLVINHEIYHRSDIGYGSSLEHYFYKFVNWSILHTLSSSIVIDNKKLAEKFCRHILSDGDTIITYNYDLLIDIALFKSGIWYPAYKKNNHYYCNYWDKKIYNIDNSIFPKITGFAGNSLINFIKIHGSINWFYTENKYDIDINSEFSRDLAKLYSLENGKSFFNKDFKINHFRYLIDRDYYKKIEELCILKPALGKQYLKYPFSYLTNKAINYISKAKEIIIIGYSLPLYDTLSEFFILNAPPKCKITIVNIGNETQRLRERIVRSGGFEWNNVRIFENGLENWLNINIT